MQICAGIILEITSCYRFRVVVAYDPIKKFLHMKSVAEQRKRDS